MDKLAGQPELEAEARLTDALAQMPDVPVPSNFTARVLDAIELEEKRSALAVRAGRWNWRALLPRVAVAAAVVMVCGLEYRHHQVSVQRVEMAKSLLVATSAAGVPSMDALENLDAIQRMSQPARADTELLADMQ